MSQPPPHHEPASSLDAPYAFAQLPRTMRVALGGAPTPAGWPLVVGALALGGAVLLRLVMPECTAPTPERALAPPCVVRLACQDPSGETLMCASDVPAALLMPYAPAAWIHAAFTATDCARRPLVPVGRLHLGGMSQGMRLALGESVDLLRAEAQVLALLPGMSARSAAALVAWRTQAGDIPTLAHLGAVPQMGRRRLAQLAAVSELMPLGACDAPRARIAEGLCPAAEVGEGDREGAK